MRESRLRLLLGPLRTSSQVSVALPRNYFTLCCVFLDTPLCFARFVSFLACEAACRFSATSSKSTCSNWMTTWASFADGLRLLQSFWHRPLLQLVPCFLDVCNLFLSVSNLGCRLSFLLSFRQTSRSQPPSHVFVLRLPSLQSTWLLQRSATVCCTSCCFCVTPFHTSSVLCCCFSRNRFFSSAAFYSSTSISSSISTWCSLAQFLLCCNVLMTFIILVSRHGSNSFLRDIVFLVRCSLLLAMLFRFF